MNASKSKGAATPLASPSSRAARNAASFSSLSSSSKDVSLLISRSRPASVTNPGIRRFNGSKARLRIDPPASLQRQGGTVDQAAEPKASCFDSTSIQRLFHESRRQGAHGDRHRQVQKIAVGIEFARRPALD